MDAAEHAPTAAGQSSGGRLLRVLGFAFALAMSIGSIIGGGILRTPGSVVDRVPDVTLVLSLWALGGLHALLAANVVSELITSVPKAGGLYVPARRAFGDFAGLLIGWSDWLINAAAIAALALACSEFAAVIEPGLESRRASVAVALLAGLFLLNLLGVREGSIAQRLGSLVKFLLLLVLIATIFLFVPAAPARAAQIPGGAGISVLAAVVGYQLVYGAFTGWPNPIYFVEEDENAASNIPKAMALSIIAVTAVYLVMNYALLHALPIEQLRASELPASVALIPVFGPASTTIIAVVAIVIVVSCLNGVIMVIPRVLYGLGRDGLFLRMAQHVNSGGTPDVALLMSAALSMLLALTGEFETVFLLMGGLVMFTMIITDASLFALRWKEPDLARPFKAIGYPVLPTLLLLIDALLFAAVLAADPWSGFYMLLLIGLSVPIALWLRRGRALAPPAVQ